MTRALWARQSKRALIQGNDKYHNSFLSFCRQVVFLCGGQTCCRPRGARVGKTSMVIDFIPSLYNPISVPSVEGRCHEASWKRGGMRCPRAWGIRIPGARAAPGFRPGALGPPARSSLTVRATCRKADQPPKARPGRRQDTAMERRGAQVSPIARRNLAPTRCDPLWAPRGAPFPHRHDEGQATGEVRRTRRRANNTGADACAPNASAKFRSERAARNLRPE
jgi:hypothetical protein